MHKRRRSAFRRPASELSFECENPVLRGKFRQPQTQKLVCRSNRPARSRWEPRGGLRPSLSGRSSCGRDRSRSAALARRRRGALTGAAMPEVGQKPEEGWEPGQHRCLKAPGSGQANTARWRSESDYRPAAHMRISSSTRQRRLVDRLQLRDQGRPAPPSKIDRSRAWHKTASSARTCPSFFRSVIRSHLISRM